MAAYTTVEVNVTNEWPAPWRGEAADQNIKFVEDLFLDNLMTLSGSSEIFNGSSFTKASVDLERQPNEIFSLASYASSRFYKDYVRNVSGRTKYNLKAGSATIPVYVRKSDTSTPLDETPFTNYDLETTSSAAINCIVDDVYRKNGLWCMTGKSRVIATDDGIEAMASVLSNYYGRSVSPARVVKCLNAGVCNKSQQFRRSPWLDKNIFATCIITGAMLATKNQESTMTIASQRLSKIINIKNTTVDRFDQDLVMMLVEQCNVVNTWNTDSLRDLINAIKNQKSGPQYTSMNNFGVHRTGMGNMTGSTLPSGSGRTQKTPQGTYGTGNKNKVSPGSPQESSGTRTGTIPKYDLDSLATGNVSDSEA